MVKTEKEDSGMKKRHTEEQIIGILNEVQARLSPISMIFFVVSSVVFWFLSIWFSVVFGCTSLVCYQPENLSLKCAKDFVRYYDLCKRLFVCLLDEVTRFYFRGLISNGWASSRLPRTASSPAALPVLRADSPTG